MRRLLLAATIFLTMSVGGHAATVGDGSQSAMDYVRSASRAYLKGDYPEAIRLYSAALELHRKSPTLDRNTWRVVVDNLGMSHGISGDNKTAKTIFEYGLSEDPTYPIFHYNLACAYAELNDLDNALVHLKAAAANKANMIPGERMPDPRTDSSFRPFLQDERFRKTVSEFDAK